jgi:hypothetical protein
MTKVQVCTFFHVAHVAINFPLFSTIVIRYRQLHATCMRHACDIKSDLKPGRTSFSGNRLSGILRNMPATSKAKPRRPVADPHRTLRAVTVDNPYFSRAHAGAATNPRTIPAVVNIRESAITMLASRNRIDAAQVAAATKFRALFEAMGGKGASAIDYGREHVDGGKRADPISERQMAAADELRRTRQALGNQGYWLVSRICGEGFSLHEVVRPGSSKRAKLAAANDLRACLDTLAELWGIATRR